MAFGATPVYVASWNHGTPEPIQTMINEEVDVINMSFGPGESTTSWFMQSHVFVTHPNRSRDAFDQGIFLVNSTGNFSTAYTGKTKDDCLTNPHATLPRVFAVAGLLNRTYEYSSPGFNPYWEEGYTSALYPSSPDDYWNMRVNPLSSQTGGADLKINGTLHSRAMTVVDLVAPEGGYNTTHPDGTNGHLGEFFGGSSGAAPHVSGLAMLVKHHFLQNNVPLMNYPGWLHTVMLAMGDRGFWNTTSLVMQKRSFGGDRVYGFGKVKLRRPLPGNFRMINKTWTASSFPSGYYAERIWPYPATLPIASLKG
jgi:subtilisin family serine protease